MRPVAFGEALTAGTRLTLFSDDKPDRFFTVIKFWMDATSSVALELKTCIPTYQVEDEEGRTHLLIHLAIEEQHEHRGVSSGLITQALIRGASFWEALIGGRRSYSRPMPMRHAPLQLQFLCFRCFKNSCAHGLPARSTRARCFKKQNLVVDSFEKQTYFYRFIPH